METSQRRVWKSTGTKVAVILPLLVFLMLSACGPNHAETPGYATWTPSPSATATCDPNTSLSTPEGWTFKTQLLVILYDTDIRDEKSIMGNNYLELSNGEKTQDVPHFVSSSVPALMREGDQASVFYLGYSSYNDARVARIYSYLTPPPLYNTPAFPPSLTPSPSPTTTPQPGYLAVKATEVQKIESTAIVGTQEAVMDRYGCQKNLWNNMVLITATAWDVTATAESTENNSDLEDAMKKVESKGKPFATDELYYNSVYGGLSFATRVFQSDCQNYNLCNLLIISDMHFMPEGKPSDLVINLSGVKTYVIMPACPDLLDQDCKKTEDYWDAEFPQFGGAKPHYLTGVHAETNLLNAIGR